MFELFCLLAFAHFLADYPLQGDFLSKAKNHTAPIAGVPWYQAMAAHCGIHAGLVGLITGSIWLAWFEFVVHFITDYCKCRGLISYDIDQLIHLWTKMLITGVVSWGLF